MAYIQNFESDAHKHQRMENAPTSNYNPLDNSTLKVKSNPEKNFFESHLQQYSDFISWARWYPDLFLDLIKPKKGGVNLHFDQRVFLRGISRFSSIYGVFPRGWGKCVAGDTYLFSDKGIIPIKKLFKCKENGIEDYTEPLDLHVINKNNKSVKVDRGVYNGYKDTKKITTSFGYNLECSLNHPVLIEKEPGVLDYVLAQDLRKGDKVVISTFNNLWGKNKNLRIDKNFIGGKKSFKMICTITEDLALILGFLIGKGCYSNKHTVSFFTKDEAIAKKYTETLKSLNIETKFYPKTGYQFCGVGIRKYFKQMGFDYVTSKDKEIPSIFLQMPKKYLCLLLRGIFDTLGHIAQNNKCLFIEHKSHKLLHQIQLILLNLGIVSSLRLRKDKDTYYLRLYSRNVNKFYREIGFTSPDMLKQYNKIRSKKKVSNSKRYKTHYFLDEIEEIEDSKNHVYDISVPATHSFVSNGLVSHNTWGEVISMFVTAILYPGITMSLTAQTKANAAELLKDKYDEIVEQYPLIKNEILKASFTKDDSEIRFVNGSRIDVLANAQTSKGQRRNRMEIEESALIDNYTYEDALAPIVEIGRTTQGELGVIDPLERNQQINFFTTSGFRGSDEWERSVRMYKDMTNLKGDIVLGSGWMLGCWMGRGSNKLKIMKKKKTMGATAFARNYEEKWVGAVDHQLVDINKLLKTRTLTAPVLDNKDNKREIILGVDVARSANTNNNKTIISVIEEHHADNGLIKRLDLINMFLVSNQLNFTAQACLVKKIQLQYNAKMVVVDTNGLGSGLRDELLKPNVDVTTGDSYMPWDTVNGEIRSEYREARPMFYALNSQEKDETKKDGRINSYAIINFIDCVEGQKLRLLEERKDNSFNLADIDEVKAFVPYQQTNALVEEISNLKLRHLTNGEMTVEKVLSRVDKDRFSSLIYGLWWAMTYDNKLKTDSSDLVMTIAQMNKIGGRNLGNSLSKIFK